MMAGRMTGAVDIGGTKIAVGLVDDGGRVAARGTMLTGAAGSFEAAMRDAAALLERLLAETGVQLRAIGIGSTGPVDPETGAFGNVPFFPHWEGRSPAEFLARAFGVSVAVENDADAGALAEAAWGAARDHARVLFVTVGTGIGVGIVLDGQVYRGAGGAHPEIGHQVVDASGPACSCGARGCWEALASGPRMAAWFRAHAPSGATYGATAEEICVRAKAGDEWARRAVEQGGFYLGLGLANLVNIFVPDAIVLGGSVMRSADLFLDQIRETIRDSCRLVPEERTRIAVSSLGADVGLIGAAEVWHSRQRKTGAALA
jgi:glucokinase